jgi:hypothetical protein
MFAALERLGNEEMTDEQLRTEMSRSKAISDIGKVIVESAKTELLYAKISGKRDEEPRRFLEEDDPIVKRIERPKAEYSNHSPARENGLTN